MTKVDIGYLVVGLAAAAAAFGGSWLTRRSKRDEVQAAAQSGVLTGWDDLTERLSARLDAVEERLRDAEVRASRAEQALNKAQLVISLLVAQIRSLGAEPDLPEHLGRELDTDT